MMKLISITTEKPVAWVHSRPCLLKHPTANQCVVKEHRILSERNYPPVPNRRVLNDLPRIINAACIEHINEVRPSEQMIERLRDDVAFIANG